MSNKSQAECCLFVISSVCEVRPWTAGSAPVPQAWKEYIEEHITEKITLRMLQVAEYCRGTQRGSSEVTGLSPFEYIRASCPGRPPGCGARAPG